MQQLLRVASCVFVLLARPRARFDVLLARPRARFDVLLARPRARFDLLLSKRALLVAACGMALVTLPAPSSHAQTSEVPEGYVQLIDEALSEADQRNFGEARALFLRAHALYPNARTLRGLAIMSYELRAYAESMSYYEQALRSRERPLEERLRADAQAQLARARRFVAELTLSLTPPETLVLVDNRPLTLEPSNMLRLDLGPHSLKFEAAGYRSETRNVDVRGGESLQWTVALELAQAPRIASTVVSSVSPPKPVARSVPQPAHDDAARRLYRNPWLWTGVALATVAIATGVGIALRPDPKTVEQPPQTSAQSPPNGVIYTLVRSP